MILYVKLFWNNSRYLLMCRTSIYFFTRVNAVTKTFAKDCSWFLLIAVIKFSILASFQCPRNLLRTRNGVLELSVITIVWIKFWCLICIFKNRLWLSFKSADEVLNKFPMIPAIASGRSSHSADPEIQIQKKISGGRRPMEIKLGIT